MKLFTPLVILIAMLFSACDKKEPIVENVQGVMLISDSGACNVLIKLNNSLTLFPTTFDKVEPFLTNGRQVTVSYRIDKDFVSTCPGAKPAIIESIR